MIDVDGSYLLPNPSCWVIVMPTIHRERGFRFVVYLDDHEPAHVHVWHGGAVARIEIGDAERAPNVTDAGLMKTATLRRAIRIIERSQEHFLAAWKAYHGEVEGQD